MTWREIILTAGALLSLLGNGWQADQGATCATQIEAVTEAYVELIHALAEDST